MPRRPAPPFPAGLRPTPGAATAAARLGAAAGLLALTLTGCAGDAAPGSATGPTAPATESAAVATGAFPAGTFVRDPAGVYRFSPDGLYLYWQQDQQSDLTAGGTYEVDGSTFTSGRSASLDACTTEGSYDWLLEGDDLAFEEIDEPCRSRADGLSGQTYTRTDQPDADVGDFPTGTFVHVDGPDSGRFAFTRDGMWLHWPSADEQPDVAGAFTVDGATFTESLNTQSATRDPGRQVPARYTWTFDGTTLTFTLTGTDDSTDRVAAYDGQNYVVQR